MASRIPPLLEPYLSLPPETSLILLTNVLSASTNWLVLRYLYSFLTPQALDPDAEEGELGGTTVVLVSFLRDWAFWRDGARKLGLDLVKDTARKQFIFVDGLTSLFLPAEPTSSPSKASPPSTSTPIVLQTPEIARIQEVIISSIHSLQGAEGQDKPNLIIDGLDVLLATSASADPAALNTAVMELRERVHSAVLCLASDEAFVHRQRTPLEINQASFLLSMAHMADLVVSLRGLDTGSARDVSGVLRISRVGGKDRVDEGQGEEENGRELLYYVGGDGGVKVFERGE